MRLQLDFKRIKTILTVVAKNKNGIKFSFAVYPYANVISIGSAVKQDDKTIGHVVFGDYEKRLTKKRRAFITDYITKNNIGMILFFRSSRDKLHFIIPQVFESYLECLHHAHKLGAEQNYLTISATRGEFVLRLSRKGAKDEPRFKEALINNSIHPFLSKPHVDLITKFYNLDKQMFNMYPTLGDALETEFYRTTNVN